MSNSRYWILELNYEVYLKQNVSNSSIMSVLHKIYDSASLKILPSKFINNGVQMNKRKTCSLKKQCMLWLLCINISCNTEISIELVEQSLSAFDIKVLPIEFYYEPVETTKASALQTNSKKIKKSKISPSPTKVTRVVTINEVVCEKNCCKGKIAWTELTDQLGQLKEAHKALGGRDVQQLLREKVDFKNLCFVCENCRCWVQTVTRVNNIEEKFAVEELAWLGQDVSKVSVLKLYPENIIHQVSQRVIKPYHSHLVQVMKNKRITSDEAGKKSIQTQLKDLSSWIAYVGNVLSNFPHVISF
jgi:hypothetical protein